MSDLDNSKQAASSLLKTWKHVDGWKPPYVSISPLDEVVWEWYHGDKKITVYITYWEVTILRVFPTRFVDGDISWDIRLTRVSSFEDFADAWRWLHI